MLPLILLTSLAGAAPFAPGETIHNGAAIQVTEAGLMRLEDGVPAVVPPSFPVEDQDQGSGSFYLRTSGMWVGIVVTDLRLIPRQNVLDIEIDTLVRINEPGDPFHLEYKVLLGEECDTWVAPFPVNITMPATMEVVQDPETGDRVVQAHIGTVTLVNGLTSAHIDPGDPNPHCNISYVEDVASALGFSLIDFFIDLVEQYALDIVVEDQRADMEAQINDALLGARFEDSLDLAGAQLDVVVEPEAVAITPEGLEIIARSTIGAEQGACMATRDPGGSLSTDTPIPTLGSLPSSTEFAVQVSDDSANQALYAVWRSGLFCYELVEGGEVELPIPLDTSLLGILGGEGYEALFPEAKAMRIVTSPDAAPVVDYTAAQDIVVQVRELGVDFFAEVDFRQARALGVDLEADAGADLDFDGTTGELALDVALTAEDITVVPSHVELVKGSEEAVQAGFGGLLDVLLDQFLGDALADQTFPIPSMGEFGLTTLSASSSGGGDWLQVRAGLGPVTYDNSDAEGGCGEGCATGPGAAGLLWLLPLALLRRRRA